jgi:hypothetical protein
MSFVYFIRESARGYVKIGYAANVQSRLKGLQTASPAPLEIMAVIKCSRETETDLHIFYDQYREIGEWFRPAPAILEAAELALRGLFCDEFLEFQRLQRKRTKATRGATLEDLNSSGLVKIVKRFGGYTEMARVMSVPISTVHAWKRRGKVPAWRINSIEAALKTINSPKTAMDTVAGGTPQRPTVGGERCE